jgi:hypothetical protein
VRHQAYLVELSVRDSVLTAPKGVNQFGDFGQSVFGLLGMDNFTHMAGNTTTAHLGWAMVELGNTLRTQTGGL